jgi:hypothetical protein
MMVREPALPSIHDCTNQSRHILQVPAVRRLGMLGDVSETACHHVHLMRVKTMDLVVVWELE